MRAPTARSLFAILLLIDEGLAFARSGERRFQPLVVDRRIRLRTHIALPGPCAHAVHRRGQHAGKIERTDAARLLQQVRAAYSVAQARETRDRRACARRSLANPSKKRMMCSGLPRNFARSSGFCVAMPVGQVLR